MDAFIHFTKNIIVQLESEDPLRSLKVVEVEKKKEKERQARNVSH